MEKKGIIFADIDNTLIFHADVHNLEKRDEFNSLVVVYNPATEKEYLTHDASSDLYKAFLDINTRSLAIKLREAYHFVYITGARMSTMDARKHILDFADAYILENGGLILRGDYTPDTEWSKRFEHERPYLNDVQEKLQEQGWNLDIKGRTSAIRIRNKDNPEKSKDEFEELCESVELPPQLKKTMNLSSLDIILASAGKGNAVNYVTNELGPTQTIGIGDDINDIEMLEHVGQAYVLGSSYPEVLKVAKQKEWYISEGLQFDGINEVLRKIHSTD